MHVQKLLEEHNYDTVGNFLDLYEGFRKNQQNSLMGFVEYFQSYSPPITSGHHTCVGLALELWNRLHQLDCAFPGLSEHLYVVSCEENIESLNEYAALSGRLESSAYDLEKEHVLLCLKFEIQGRSGLLLCDPGYHVGRVVTVMQDKAYPNTGWFLQSEENNITKEYNYQFSSLNDKFVEWYEKTTRNDKQDIFIGLIYVSRPYLTAVDVTERRNLVYDFRSLLSRDQKGHLVAGVYFKVKENCDEFTLFYQDNMSKQRVKMKFSSILQSNKLSEETSNILSLCNEQLNLPEERSLLKILQGAGELLNDKSYLQQLLDVNQSINTMAANN